MDVRSFLTDFNTLSIGDIKMDHAGVISSFFDETGLVSFVDDLLPKNHEHNATYGESFKFIALSIFREYQGTLYNAAKNLSLFPLFLLFHRDVDLNDFNDDVLADFFEAVQNFGVSAFYLRIVQHLATRLPRFLDFDVLHVEMINFALFGRIERFSDDGLPETIVSIALGRPKDDRSVISLLTYALVCNSMGIPVYMKELSGDRLDQEELNSRARLFHDFVKDAEISEAEPLCLTDPAFYREEYIRDFPAYFIARVPEKIAEARELIAKDVETRVMEQDDGYSFFAAESSYGGVEQTWLLVHSRELAEKQERAFEKRLEKETSLAFEALKILENRSFASCEDAQKGAEIWISKRKFCRFEKVEIISKEPGSGEKLGRPEAGRKREKSFFVKGTLALNNDAARKERLSLGRFILATNKRTLLAEEILSHYNAQFMGAKCYGYLKGKEPRVSETFVEKPERIHGLGCFMALMTLIFSLLETKLRDGLKEKGKTVTGRLGKPTSIPTLRYACERLERIGYYIFYNKSLDEFYLRLNFIYSPDLSTILEQFGEKTQSLYYKKERLLTEATVEQIIKNIKLFYLYII
ncbi:MAG: IS1634 family transposase [Deltaproteobacteria bacterium]|jgi:transposase|nr:IS1634 family transposase [Deltaproteobacteria bacterium]